MLIPCALQQLCSAQIFMKLDLHGAYNLVRIWTGDEWKTAFSTTFGHYEYSVMPYGLSFSPLVFQCFINDVLRDMLGQFVIAYISDILIYSPTHQSHIDHVKQVLAHLLENQLYVQGEKCEFNVSAVTFLGYIITLWGNNYGPSQGYASDRMAHTLSWERTANVWGFANFYLQFTCNLYLGFGQASHL